jgi:hypothetical protein
MIKNEILSEKKAKYRILKIFDFFKKWLFCRFCDEKVAVSRHVIDQF